MEVDERGGGVPEPLQGEKSGSVSKGGSMEVAETANQPMRREPVGATRIPRRPREYRGKMELRRETRHGRVKLDARRSQTRRNCHRLPCLAFTNSVGNMLGLPGRSGSTVRDASVRFVLSPTFVILVVTTMLIPNPLGYHNNVNWGGIRTATADLCGGDQHFQRLYVSQSDANNLMSIFNCENGEFNVTWSGSVNISDTIRIGSGTTVRIYGDYYNELFLGGDNGTARSSVAARGAEIIAGSPFGSMFSLDNATLNLENIALRNGTVMESTSTTPASLLYGGGGIFALDSEVKVVGCEFEEMYSEGWGGAIFATESRVEIRDTVFRRCRAGETAQAGQAEDPIGGGGAVAVEKGSLLLDGSKIEDCYASGKGGGVQTSQGNMTISNSVFKNNSVGSGNKEDEEEHGEGGDISTNTCKHAFDEDGGNCTVRDSFFSSSRAGNKGGVMQLSRGSASAGYQIEVNDCTIIDAVAGKPIGDDPQGQGGALSVSADVTLIVRGTNITEAIAGKKGGAIVMSKAATDDYEDSVGGIAILINSTFQNCSAHETGAVVYLSKGASVYVMGSLNRFEDSKVGDTGGVIYGEGDSKIVIKGGNFTRNTADEGGGVIRSLGRVNISDGIFSHNEAASMGGVISIGDKDEMNAILLIEGGVFKENNATDGGVVYVDSEAAAVITGGVYSENRAENGGVFFVEKQAAVSVEGGKFTSNAADSGGFLYKTGEGYANCSGTFIKDHYALNGGAIYAWGNAKLSWKCDLSENEALTGPAIYAREGSTVALQHMKLQNNVVSRGSIVFLVDDSTLTTFQVEFLDPGSEDISAVQTLHNSSYTAEATVFSGFAGEAVIYSRGNLTLDDCDFSKSSAEVLVDAAGSDGDTYIRNAVLGDENYKFALKVASAAAEVPNVDSIVDPILYCESDGVSSVCGNDTVCINGDLGVYCDCYSRAISGKEMCVVAQKDKLDLREENSSGETFYPDLIEVGFVLSLGANSDDANASSSGRTWTVSSTDASSVRFSSDLGVIWNASALGVNSCIDWTVFPSNGLLPPGESIYLRLVGEACDSFDGTDDITVTVEALERCSSHGDGESSMTSPAVSVATAASAATTQASSSSSCTPNFVTATTEITFYHCPSSNVWDDAKCTPCQEVQDIGELEGLNCSSPGASREHLPIRKGYWRGNTTDMAIRECLNKDACSGGTEVEDPDGYCNEGYEGPLCAVCSSNYGRGVANSCHQCTESFKWGMYFVLALGGLITVLVGIILAIYLVGGARAVSSTLNSTRESVFPVRKRSVEYMGTSVSVTAHAGVDASTGYKSPVSTQHPIRWRIITDSGADGGTGEDGEFSPSKLRSRRYLGRAPGLYGQWRRTAKVGGAASGAGVIDLSNAEGGCLDISESRGQGDSPMKRKLGMKESKSGDHWQIFNADEHKRSGYSRPMGADARDAGSRTLSPDRMEVASDRGAHSGEVKVDLEVDAHAVAPSTMPQSLSPQLSIGSERLRWMEGIRCPPPPPVSLGGREDSDVSQSNWRGNRHWSHGDGMGGAPALALRGEEKIVDRENPFDDATPPNGAERHNGIDACRDKEQECDKSVVHESSARTCTVGGSVIVGAGRATAPGSTPPGGKGDPTTKEPGTSVTNGGDLKKKTMAARIGAILSILPLSKLKIIIVVWQILSAFSDITKVPFPPVYERFLETIGIVTFDLGWIFSAACLTTRINFYDKLLMVTLGPVVLLCLLGITFFLGSRGGPTDQLKRCYPNGDASEVPRIPTEPERSAINQGGAGETTSTPQGHGGPRAGAGEYGVLQELRPALASDADGDGKNEAGSAPIPAPLIGGIGQPQRSLRAILTTGPGAGDLAQKHLWELFARHTTMTLIILYLVYSQVSTVIFQTFSCADLTEIDKSYLWADFTIECDTPTHKAYEVYASVMMIIYPFGIPAAFWYFLNHQRTRINPKIKEGQDDRDSVEDMEKKMKKRMKDASVAPTSFLWAAYVPHRYFFEVFECMRRLLLTGLLVFTIPDSPEQIAISCMFSFISLMAFELLRPHADDLDLQLYRTGCLVIFFSNFLALIIKAKVASPDDTSSKVFAVILVIVNIFFFLSVFWNAYLSAKVIVSPSHMQGNILGVDLVREDKLGTIIPTASTSLAKAKQGSRRFLFGWKRKKSEAVSSIPEDGEGLPKWERGEGVKASQVPPAWRKDGAGSSATKVPSLDSKEARTSTAAQGPPVQETQGTTAVTLGAPGPQGSSVPSEGSTDNRMTSNTTVGAAETLMDAASSRAVSSAIEDL